MSRVWVCYLQKDWWAGLHASTVGADGPSPGNPVICQLVHPWGKNRNMQLHYCGLTSPKGRHIGHGSARDCPQRRLAPAAGGPEA